jgi:hypothetical protein
LAESDPARPAGENPIAIRVQPANAPIPGHTRTDKSRQHLQLPGRPIRTSAQPQQIEQEQDEQLAKKICIVEHDNYLSISEVIGVARRYRTRPQDPV